LIKITFYFGDVVIFFFTLRARLNFIRQLEPQVDAVLLARNLFDVGCDLLRIVRRQDVWGDRIQQIVTVQNRTPLLVMQTMDLHTEVV
jgi:hypothetical protein